jgi:uncharacterized protein
MHRSTRHLTAALALMLACTLAGAATPSFLCSKARTWLEKTICGSERLSALDLQLAVAYARLLKVTRGEERRALEAAQRDWSASRQACRQDLDPVACLEERYVKRIDALETRPDYPGDAPARDVELPPRSIALAGRGWTRDLSKLQRAMRACREEMPAPLAKVLAAWPAGDEESYGMRVVDQNGQEWTCIAHMHGHKVFRFEKRDPGEALPDAGPVYHIGPKAPSGCRGAVQVLDVNGKPAGWITETDC